MHGLDDEVIMELWDVYDKNFVKIEGMTLIRGEYRAKICFPVPPENCVKKPELNRRT